MLQKEIKDLTYESLIPSLIDESLILYESLIPLKIDAEVVALIKYLSIFWTFLDLLLINCEI